MKENENGKKTEKKKSCIHEGHRQRMRQRYLDSHGEGFQSHELLEMLLFYGLPRQDTNALAHQLIDHFGSLEAVLTAPLEDLVTVPGVKENTAVLIRLISDLARRVALESEAPPSELTDVKELYRYIQNLYIGVKVERVHLLLFDNGMKLLRCVNLGEGSVNCVNIVPRNIIREAITSRASAVVLVHNHPDGVAVPSDDDRNCTFHLQQVLKDADIQLVEHFVVAGKAVTPILHREKGSYAEKRENAKTLSLSPKDFAREFEEHCWELAVEDDDTVWI